jgi:hypothetical protein
MKLTYTGDQIDRFIEAQKRGLRIVEVRPDWVLSLDIDPKQNIRSSIDTFMGNFHASIVGKFNTIPSFLFEPAAPLFTISESGRGIHVYIAVTRAWTELTLTRRAQIAILLGSDPAREKYCFDRAVAGRATNEANIERARLSKSYERDESQFVSENYVMFETTTSFQLVSAWHSLNGVYFSEVGAINPQSRTYDVVRHFPTSKPKKGLESLYGQYGQDDAAY